MNVINEPAATGSPSGVAKNPLTLAPQAAASSSLVLIDCGEFNLLIPNDEIISIAATHQLMSSQSTQNCGYVEYDQYSYPVFCLNKPLQLQASLLPAHHIIVLLEHQGHRFGISCCEFIKVNELSQFSQSSGASAKKIIFYKVPVCMTSRKQPFSEFAVINRRAAGLSSAAALFDLLQMRGATLTAQQNESLKMLQGAS